MGKKGKKGKEEDDDDAVLFEDDPFGDLTANAKWEADLDAFAALYGAFPDLAKRPGMIKFDPWGESSVGEEVWDALDKSFESSMITLAFARQAPKKRRRKKKKKKGGDDGGDEGEEGAGGVTFDLNAFVQVPATQWYARVTPKPKAVLKYVTKVLNGFFGLDPERVVASNFVNEGILSKMSKAVTVCASSFGPEANDCSVFQTKVGECTSAPSCSKTHVRGHEANAVSMLCTKNLASEDGCSNRSCPYSHSLKNGLKRGSWFVNAMTTSVVEGETFAVTCEPSNRPGNRIRQLSLSVTVPGVEDGAPARALLGNQDAYAAIIEALTALDLPFATVWIDSPQATEFTVVPDAADWDGLVSRFPGIGHLGAPRHEHELWEAVFLARHPEVAPFFEDDE